MSLPDDGAQVVKNRARGIGLEPGPPALAFLADDARIPQLSQMMAKLAGCMPARPASSGSDHQRVGSPIHRGENLPARTGK